MLHYEFMRHAFLASALVGLLAGPIGWFLVLRGQSFAAHALSHIGFAGACAALWAHVAPLWGMGAASILGGFAIGREGQGSDGSGGQGRDMMIGLVLAASLGFGLLCLQQANAPGGAATALLFGDVLGVSSGLVQALGVLAVLLLAGLAVLARPLLFASLDREAALAAGVPIGFVSGGFMMLAAAGVAACSEITGVLLTFSLMIGPAASLLRLGVAPLTGLVGSAGLAVVVAWAGLAASWWTNAPVAFWIGALGTLVYVAAYAFQRFYRNQLLTEVGLTLEPKE